MPESDTPVVVDTNILFSALLRRSTRFAQILLQDPHSFVICESVLIELFSKKEKLVSLTRLESAELEKLLHLFLRRMALYKEDLIPSEHRQRAWELCGSVDPEDVPHVALTLAVNCLLWTGDQRLRAGLAARGFTRFFTPNE